MKVTKLEVALVATCLLIVGLTASNLGGRHERTEDPTIKRAEVVLGEEDRIPLPKRRAVVRTTYQPTRVREAYKLEPSAVEMRLAEFGLTMDGAHPVVINRGE